MSKTFSLILNLLVAALLFLTSMLVRAEEMSGKDLAFDRRLGNCLACHSVADGTLPGNIGPPIIAMKARFPDKAKLREQIYDATALNPHSMMPPFGRHGILTDEQVDKITDFIYSL